jgi:hypothetical protein
MHENHDDIMGTLQAHFGAECNRTTVINKSLIALITEKKVFLQHLKEEENKFKPLGKKVREFQRQVPI